MSDAASASIVAISEALKIAAETHETKNLPDMRTAAQRQREVDCVSEETRRVFRRDLDALRKALSE